MLLQNILLSIMIILIYGLFWYAFSQLKKRSDLADIAWGLGFITLYTILLLVNKTFNTITIIVFFIILIWGLRLATHIYQRNKNKTEDFRYKKWREDWGKWFWLRSYLQIFLLQGILMGVIATPLIFLVSLPTTNSKWIILAILIWLFGFVFESVSDKQLSNFLKDTNNKGKIMVSGLWKYSRHPNYFGEVTQWWGIFLISYFATQNFYSIIGPITISFLILKVSGIPMLEKKYEGNLDFLAYKQKTNAFFPWFPKK